MGNAFARASAGRERRGEETDMAGAQDRPAGRKTREAVPAYWAM